MRASDFFPWMRAPSAADRDALVEEFFGIAGAAPDRSPPGFELVGYHACGVDAIVAALREARITKDDTVVDLGSGLGKAALLAKLLTPARVRGIEIQPDLVAAARAAAGRLRLDVAFEVGDARDATLDDGTVFLLYCPFEGSALRAVVSRLRHVASHHPIRVCALGIDLPRDATWLVPRPSEHFWLTVYDGVLPPSASAR